MRNQIDLGIFNFGVFLQIYQLCFLFLCNQVLGRESIHNGLESVDNDRFLLDATPTQHCACNTFYEKPNVTRASILKNIILQNNGHWCEKFIECISMHL